MSKSKQIRLTGDEYNVLNKISANTKEDCWFWIHTRKDGFDVVKDLEKNRYMSMRAGVRLLNEGIVSYELCLLTDKEIIVYEDLLKKLKIYEFPPKKA